MPQIQSVSVKHEAIMDYLLVNPAAKLSTVALHFNVSAPWLSTIIHSDAFQAVLAAKQELLFSSTVLPLREQLMGVAHLGVEKLGEVMENASTATAADRDFIVDTTDKILKNLGFSPRTVLPTVQQNNYLVVDRQSLAEARSRLRQVHTVQEEPIDCPPALPAE